MAIPYSNDIGNVEEQAHNLLQDFRAHGMKGIFSSTEDFDTEELPKHTLLIIVVPMCGLGE